eukprot:GDKJ01046651.1.p1 GENE.GDKJ01046651.1~~GDKJ01046651.1.p1  ORF type:complete len:561 (-),score=99.93 GDKJ01046651.1:68-1513(-)
MKCAAEIRDSFTFFDHSLLRYKRLLSSKENVKENVGFIHLKPKAVFFGAFKDKNPHGTGILLINDCLYYSESWRADSPHPSHTYIRFCFNLPQINFFYRPHGTQFCVLNAVYHDYVRRSLTICGKLPCQFTIRNETYFPKFLDVLVNITEKVESLLADHKEALTELHQTLDSVKQKLPKIGTQALLDPPRAFSFHYDSWFTVGKKLNVGDVTMTAITPTFEVECLGAFGRFYSPKDRCVEFELLGRVVREGAHVLIETHVNALIFFSDGWIENRLVNNRSMNLIVSSKYIVIPEFELTVTESDGVILKKRDLQLPMRNILDRWTKVESETRNKKKRFEILSRGMFMFSSISNKACRKLLKSFVRPHVVPLVMVEETQVMEGALIKCDNRNSKNEKKNKWQEKIREEKKLNKRKRKRLLTLGSSEEFSSSSEADFLLSPRADDRKLLEDFDDDALSSSSLTFKYRNRSRRLSKRKQETMLGS